MVMEKHNKKNKKEKKHESRFLYPDKRPFECDGKIKYYETYKSQKLLFYPQVQEYNKSVSAIGKR